MDLNPTFSTEQYNTLSPDQRWEKMYDAAVDFITKEGKLPSKDYLIYGVTLLNWIRSHSSTNQKNEAKRNRIKTFVENAGILSTKDHWNAYFPMLQEHFLSRIPLRYATDKKFQEWSRDLKRRWHDDNIEKNRRELLVAANYEYLIVEDMLTYELLKEFVQTCDDIELYKFNKEQDENETELAEDTFDILSFLKRELIKRDNNELSSKKVEVLALFDKFDLKMTASQKIIKEIVKDELQQNFIMKDVEQVVRKVFQTSLNTLFDKTNNEHYHMMIHILDSKNQTAIAGMCGLSKERIRQLFNIVKDQFRVDLKNNLDLFKAI